jgi:hypothetical protein
MNTFLQLVTDFTNKCGLPTFGGIIGSTDATAKQLLSISQEVVEAMQDYPWENQVLRKTFTQKVGEDQGTLISIFGADYKGLVPNTLWNNTLRRPLIGPQTDPRYQMLKGLNVGGPLQEYRIAQGKLWIVPAPTNATDSLSAIYRSNNLVIAVGGTLPTKSRISADDDSFIFPDRVFKLQLEWRWKRQKGEPWATLREDAQDAVAKGIFNDNAMPTLDLSNCDYSEIQPGIWVPAGSWPV